MSKGPNVVDRVVEFFDQNPYAELTPNDIRRRWNYATETRSINVYLNQAVGEGLIQVVRRERHNVPVYGKGHRRGTIPRNQAKRQRYNDGGKLLAQVWR